jgi:hypothetical protein
MLGLSTNVDAVYAERHKNTEVFALVVASEAMNKAYEDELYPNLGSWKSNTSYSDIHATRAGYQAGLRATVDRTLEGAAE